MPRLSLAKLERIAATKRESARLKGEKDAFEQSNQPDDLDEEKQAAWNFPKDLERQRKELRAEHRDALTDLAKKNKAASLGRATANQRKAAQAAKLALQPVLAALAAIDDAVAPYTAIKDQFAAARADYRGLLNDFVAVLQARCKALSEPATQALVLRLLANDVRHALDAALTAKRQELVKILESLWDKYAVTLESLRGEREVLEKELETNIQQLTRYLARWFAANSDIFLRKTTEATHGTKKLDLKELHCTLIQVPPPSEQTRIIDLIAAHDRQLATEQATLSKLRQLKSGLMTDLLEGRVRVPEII